VATQITPIAFAVVCGIAVSGRVVEALGATAIANSSVTLRNGFDANPASVAVGTTTTNGSGDFSILAQPGNYTITAGATGFVSQSQNVTVPSNGQLTVNFALAPTLSPGQVRIILTWGATPTDMDAHLWGPDGLGGLFHVYWDQEEFPDGSLTPDAELDLDDIDGFGPETMTINVLRAGRYCYAAYNYNQDPPRFDAVVARVIRDDGTTTTYSAPGGVDSALWTVVIFDVAVGGAVTITPINTIEAAATEPLAPPVACMP
jgi:adhesin/invasin